MTRVLVTAHLGRHFRIFGQYDYKVLLAMGYEVHIAANFNDEIDNFYDGNVIQHQIDFDRNPFSSQNFKAMKQLQQLFNDIHFDIIHCQSPSGGAVTRLAARRTRENGSKVIYTPHGLHFFKGAPIKNWIIYFNIEKLLGKFTDCMITINQEDFVAAKEKLKINEVKLIHGVGIDLNKFVPQTKDKKSSLRAEYGYSNNDFILIYAGELSYRKHQDLLIEVVSNLRNKIPNIKLLLAGVGNLSNQYQDQVIKLNLQNVVQFLGYRKDIANLMMLSDIAVSSSRQEGLPVNIMEAMATGLPLVVTDCRGNRDLIKDSENGFVVNINSSKEFEDSIEKLNKSKELRKKFSERGLQLINKFSLENVKEEMKEIYKLYL